MTPLNRGGKRNLRPYKNKKIKLKDEEGEVCISWLLADLLSTSSSFMVLYVNRNRMAY